jgi:glyoxylate/hydroxypyruvate reductase A
MIDAASGAGTKSRIRIVCKVPPEDEEAVLSAVRAALPDAAVSLSAEPGAAADEHYSIVYYDAEGLEALPNLRLIVAATAGVERLLASNTLPPGVPLVRGVSPNMTQHMVEYVLHHVLALHRQASRYREQQEKADWRPHPQPLASQRKVAILGLGVLGTACAEALAALGFDVSGWSRTAKQIHNVQCFSGEEGLARLLDGAEILVSLLPTTAGTQGLIDRGAFARLPLGASLISVSRAAVIDEAAMMEALDSGALGHAVLDVFETEPLPSEHRLWRHPRVTITPHVAGPSDLNEVASILADSIERLRKGLPLVNQVDPQAGY